jgi:murein DD-endopeptidase MepM/ murein hydrolase activator NlpD
MYWAPIPLTSNMGGTGRISGSKRDFMKTYKSFIISALILIIGGGGWWFFNTYGELEKPAIAFDHEINAVGLQKTIQITFTDKNRGLRNTSASISQGTQTHVLSSINYTDTGRKEERLTIVIDLLTMKLQNGPAVLTLEATDHSLWKNHAVVSRQITIDVTPPQLFLLNSTNHINPGGSCFIAYRTSKPVVLTGVKVNNNFFTGYPATISGKPSFISFFAFPVGASKGGVNIKVMAKDEAGNETSVNLPYLIMAKKFRSDKMMLSESFLQQKMPEFQSLVPSLRGKSPVETFIYVNGLLREDNLKTIQEICGKTSPRQLWQDNFLRMNNAAPMAQYGDKRSYMYGGKVVGESTHLGVDLASTAHSPIEAANSGVVVYTGYLGIYGNVVIIDHGLGLFSLYAHMDAIQAKNGQEVKKGEAIGQSGTSGLAGGDHLHFGIIVGGQFVNPQEWWDPHWIADNVTKKMDVSF